jgi:hypothetical protein
MPRLQFKTVLVCFFDHKGEVHHEFLAQGQTVNQQCYLEVLTKLRESVRRKRPELWSDKWILHHGNAPVQDALRFREPLAHNCHNSNTWTSHIIIYIILDMVNWPILRHQWEGEPTMLLVTCNLVTHWNSDCYHGYLCSLAQRSRFYSVSVFQPSKKQIYLCSVRYISVCGWMILNGKMYRIQYSLFAFHRSFGLSQRM